MCWRKNCDASKFNWHWIDVRSLFEQLVYFNAPLIDEEVLICGLCGIWAHDIPLCLQTYALNTEIGIERDPWQVGVTTPCDFCWNSRLGPSCPPTAVSESAAESRGSYRLFLFISPFLFLMETASSVTTQRKWDLALWVLRLHHRALRNR